MPAQDTLVCFFNAGGYGKSSLLFQYWSAVSTHLARTTHLFLEETSTDMPACQRELLCDCGRQLCCSMNAPYSVASQFSVITQQVFFYLHHNSASQQKDNMYGERSQRQRLKVKGVVRAKGR